MTMYKNIIYNEEALMALHQGAKKLAKVVKVTFGPKGRNVIIELNGHPFLTKDGITVVRNIELADPFENEGAALLKAVCEKTGEKLGDGSTTSVVLTEALLSQSIKYITAGVNVEEFISGLETGSKAVLKELDEMAKHEVSPEIINRIATVAANNDPEIGKIITKLFLKDKLLPAIFEESHSVASDVEIVQGFELNTGYYSRDFITDEENQTAEYNDSFVIVTNQKIEGNLELMTFLNKVVETGKPLTIIARDFGNELIKTLVTNKKKNVLDVLDVLAIKIPNHVSDKIMEDIALTCNTKLVVPQSGILVENLQIKDLGITQKVVSNNEKTIISGTDKKNDLLDKTIINLYLQLIREPLFSVRNELSERISRLKGEIAHVYVGASTKLEREEKKQRFKNAYASAQAAIEDGIITGGGTGYLYTLKVLNKLNLPNKNMQKGISALGQALKEPFCTIIKNAGESYPEKLDKILDQHSVGLGYNVITRQYENFFESGIIDPVKNLKTSLLDSVSFVSLLVRTKCAITEHKEVFKSKK